MDVAAALWGGILGAIAMAVVYAGFLALRLTRFDLVRFEGGLVSRERSPMVYVYGGMLHLVLGVLLALAYRYVFEQLTAATYVGWGALLGLATGIALALALPLAGVANQQVRSGAEPPPGFAGRAYGGLTPLLVVAAWVVFGVWVGLAILP